MKKLFAAMIVLGTCSAFAGESACDRFLDLIQETSNSAGKWDYQYRQNIAEYEYGETIEESRFKRDSFVTLSDISKKAAKIACNPDREFPTIKD